MKHIALTAAIGIAGVIFLGTAFARAGTLVKCDGVSTNEGYRYIGTYCVDYECKYVTRRTFTSYCPYSIN